MLRISNRAKAEAGPLLKLFIERSIEKLAGGLRTPRRLTPKGLLPAFDMVRKMVGHHDFLWSSYMGQKIQVIATPTGDIWVMLAQELYLDPERLQQINPARLFITMANPSDLDLDDEEGIPDGQHRH